MMVNDADGPSTSTGTPTSTSKSTTNDKAWWVATAETCVRITAAGFGGSLIGLSKERQEQQHHSVSVIRQAARRHRPTRTNLPVTWSLGCMVFVGVLESCRRSSPASNLLEHAQKYAALNHVQISVPETWSTPIAQQVAITIADYGIGGTVAGLAGALARRTSVLSLTTTGLALGIVAGIFQAASNAVEDYWSELSIVDVKDDNEQD